ncbi:MAG: hypothetical protein V1852_32750 [Pseudomonadota bacterium]
MRQIIICVIIILCSQLAHASDSREPIPVCINDLPNRLNVQEVNCGYFNKEALLAKKLKILQGSRCELSITDGLRITLLNLRDASKPNPSNDAYATGLLASNGYSRRCYLIKPLCDESDVHNAFHRRDAHFSGTKEEFIHLGFRIIDDCDEVHGGLNEPSCFVLTISKKNLAIDMKRFYHERPKFGDDQLPFDDSVELKYSKGYRHIPIR